MLEVLESPVFTKWPGSLRDRKARAAIVSKIGHLVLSGAGDVKFIADDVSELRVHYGPGYRVYFTKRRNIYLILLCAGDKGSQVRDIKRAKELVLTFED